AAMPVSHSSPDSRTPLPQTAPQSLSLFLLQPGAQQPSPLMHIVTGVVVHMALQVPPFCSASVVQALPSLHIVGQAPGLPAMMPASQVSPVETTPSPQTIGQSESLPALQPVGQQPSPLLQAVTGDVVHLAWHAVPVRVSVVQESPSLQLVGQA